jgi:hypothetical protein
MARFKDARKQPFFWIDNRVYRFITRMGLGALRVYCCIAYHTSGRGRSAFVSYTRMAHELGLDRRTVITAVEDLVSLGLLEKQQRATRHGLKAANRYVLLDPPADGGEVAQQPPLPTVAVGALDVPTDGALDATSVGALDAPGSQDPVEQDPVNTPLSPPKGGPARVERETTAAAPPSQPPQRQPRGWRRLTPEQRADFARVWDAYPCKEDCPGAERAWARLRPPPAEVAAMLAALERRRWPERWQRGIIPHLHKWLSGRRWEDGPPPGQSHGPLTEGGQVVEKYRALLAGDSPRGPSFAEVCARAGRG